MGEIRAEDPQLIIDAHRTIQAVIYPVTDPAASVRYALDHVDQLDMRSGAPAEQWAST